jgi:RNA polymerase sigma factor for flagellar operon FliA
VIRLNARQRKLVEDRVGLARAHGHRAWLRLVGYERDEIISYATLGLVSAALRWEDYCAENNFEAYGVDSGSWFDTYATRRIKGSIIDALRSMDPATRRERALIKQIIAAGVDLSSPWEHESAKTISAKTGLSEDDVLRAVSALVRMPVSLEETTEDTWPADACDVEEDAMQLGLCNKIVKVIQRLPDIYQLVMAMAYYKNLTDEEIADRLPEISGDLAMGPYAVQWVATMREQGASLITEVLRGELATQRSFEAMAG